MRAQAELVLVCPFPLWQGVKGGRYSHSGDLQNLLVLHLLLQCYLLTSLDSLDCKHMACSWPRFDLSPHIELSLQGVIPEYSQGVTPEHHHNLPQTKAIKTLNDHLVNSYICISELDSAALSKTNKFLEGPNEPDPGLMIWLLLIPKSTGHYLFPPITQ